MVVKIKKIHSAAKVPTYGSDGAACFDFYAVESMTINPGKGVMARTGLKFEFPKDVFLRVYPRSGLARDYKIFINSSAIIDNDYRGELIIPLFNLGDKSLVINPGDRIAQGEVRRYDRVEFEVVDKLNETSRGCGGFGSTGR